MNHDRLADIALALVLFDNFANMVRQWRVRRHLAATKPKGGDTYDTVITNTQTAIRILAGGKP